MGDYKELSIGGSDIRTYYRATVRRSDKRDLHVVCVKSLRQGNLAAGVVAKDGISRWKPKAVILLGIAGGVHKEVRIGDVIVADQIFSYEMGKLIQGSTIHRLEAYRPSALLLSIANSISDAPAQHWMSANSAKAIDHKAPGYLSKRFIGPIGSGDKVVADASAEELLYLRSVSDKVRAVEMEASGAATAIYEMRLSQAPEFIVVRGVSDHVDTPKTDEFHAFASHAAATFALAMARKLEF